MDDFKKILEGPEFFTCERFRTRMFKKRCIERQDRGYQITDFEYSTSSEINFSFAVCATCKQGQRIKEEMKNTRICETEGCNNNTLGPGCPLCPSCMAEKANKVRAEKKAAIVKVQDKLKATNKGDEGNDKPIGEKAAPDVNTTITIEFGKHVSVLKSIEAIAEKELRPIDMQVIYMLKNQLENSQEGARL